MIPNGLDLDEFVQLPAPGTFRQRVGIPADVKLVLSLGRIHRIKGLDLLIEAFGRLQETTVDAVLVIAGPDDDGELARLHTFAAKRGLHSRVQFPGPLYGVDRLAALVDADLVVAPSAYEIFGLVPFEALMCGTPVIISGDSGASRLLQGNEAVYCVPYGDASTLVPMLHQILIDGDMTQRKVQIGQEFARAMLDWQAIAGRLEELYDSLVGLHD